MIFPSTPENIKKAACVIRDGGLVAFPTETVYGLGADALNPEAAKKIYAAKKRPPTNPLIVHISDIKDLDRVTRVDNLTITAYSFETLCSLWPAPLTLVLPAAPEIIGIVTGGKKTVAVRMPNHRVALALIKESQTPIAAPSANISTRVSATTAIHVEENLGASIDMILDGGECPVGVESTILSLLEKTPKILRPGGITAEQLAEILNFNVSDSVSYTHLRRRRCQYC